MADEASTQANRSGMDPNRLVVLFLITFGVVFALFLQNVLALLWASAGWGDPMIIEGLEGWTLTGLLGTAISAGLMLFAYFNHKARHTGQDIASELLKVTWPTWGETRVSTIAVVVASVVAAVILFGIDTLAYTLMVEWLPKVWGGL